MAYNIQNIKSLYTAVKFVLKKKENVIRVQKQDLEPWGSTYFSNFILEFPLRPSLLAASHNQGMSSWSQCLRIRKVLLSRRVVE